jgi:hypothetical protein
MNPVQKSVLWLTGGVVLFAVTATITSAILDFQDNRSGSGNSATTSPSAAKVCTTIATDPNPPLHVRSSPIVAPDNIIGNLSNGTRLIVVDKSEGWLRISTPLHGWVYEKLTVTSCVTSTALKASPAQNSADSGMKTFQEATEHYHAGNLNAAIALAKTIPSSSAVYPEAVAAIDRWQDDWKTAESEYYTIQKALRDGRSQDVLLQVQQFPNNRFWKGKLTPLVREAISQQGHPHS